MDALKLMTEGMIKENKPEFNVGDTVRVSVRIKEGERERIQAFEGTVIAKKHGGIAETFTVRRSSYGVGVERVFPINSPFVEKVEVVRKAHLPQKPHRQGCQSQRTAPISFTKGTMYIVPFFVISLGIEVMPGWKR